MILLHDSLYLTSVVAALAAARRRRPLLIVQHMGAIRYRSPFLRGLMRLANRLIGAPILQSAARVVFISHVVRDHFRPLRLKSAPEIIFNGVDTDVFHPGGAAERAAGRRRFGLDSVGPVALFVGRFVEKKGLGLLRRVAELRPEATFAFAGWGLEDPSGWRLANARVFRGLAGAALANLYRASDLLVLPSRGEGFPLVVQEALATGLPVVCGAGSARADPQASVLLQAVDVEGDPAAAAQRVALAIDEARGARPEGATARAEFVRRRYGWRQAADRYAEILARLFDETPGAAERSRDAA